jgi:hypothetical protein
MPVEEKCLGDSARPRAGDDDNPWRTRGASSFVRLRREARQTFGQRTRRRAFNLGDTVAQGVECCAINFKDLRVSRRDN